MTAARHDIPEQLRGTFAGFADPHVIDHLVKLGVTAVELMPIQAFFDDRDLVKKKLVNYWGYNTVNYFSLAPRYISPGADMHEFQVLVRRLHEAGIEVILDVVYNHTAEGNHLGPTLSFRGIDNASYYMLAADKHFYFDTTGTGNTVNLRHPRVLQMVMDSLRYWVEECHVDGFRFDLATSLGREYDSFDPNAVFFDARPPGPGAVAREDDRRALGRRPERLSGRKFPARLGGVERPLPRRDALLLEGRFEHAAGLLAQHPRLGRSCSSTRAASPGRASTSSPRMTVSRSPTSGPTTASTTRRTARTTATATTTTAAGTAGVEGPSDDPAILDLRDRMRRGSMATLLLSQGTPMILMGDEVGRTQKGNNNAYCQDNEIAWLNWKNVTRSRPRLHGVRARRRSACASATASSAPTVSCTASRSTTTARGASSGSAPTARRWTRRPGATPTPGSIGLLLSDKTTRLLILVSAYHRPIPFTLPASDVAALDGAHRYRHRRDRSARPPLRARRDDRAQGPHAPPPRRGDGVRKPAARAVADPSSSHRGARVTPKREAGEGASTVEPPPTCVRFASPTSTSPQGGGYARAAAMSEASTGSPAWSASSRATSR